ncbi:hypothetical protein KAM380_038940 [Aeromonas caviae]|nr:hypothetical protein KAM380_038940 [Aeromonas caviae]
MLSKRKGLEVLFMADLLCFCVTALGPGLLSRAVRQKQWATQTSTPGFLQRARRRELEALREIITA